MCGKWKYRKSAEVEEVFLEGCVMKRCEVGAEVVVDLEQMLVEV